MSNSVFPTVPGLMWDVKKTPVFNNIIQTPVKLRSEVRIAVTSAPQYQFECSYEFLRQDAARSLAEKDTIEGFFKARNGNFDSFLLNLSSLTQDSADGAVTLAPAGIGDGATTLFQLQRSTGGYTEPVDAVSSSGFNLYKSGTLQTSGYTLNANAGTVLFTTAPVSGAIITYDAPTYYCRVRFKESQYDFDLFQWRLWQLQSLTFLSVNS